MYMSMVHVNKKKGAVVRTGYGHNDDMTLYVGALIHNLVSIKGSCYGPLVKAAPFIGFIQWFWASMNGYYCINMKETEENEQGEKKLKIVACDMFVLRIGRMGECQVATSDQRIHTQNGRFIG